MPSNFWAKDGIAMSQEAASLLVFGPGPLSLQDKFILLVDLLRAELRGTLPTIHV